MKRMQKTVLLTAIIMATLLTVTYAGPANNTGGNSFYLYTGALRQDKAGVVAVPSRYKWSVETNNSGVDLQGKPLPDPRVMLRLYDPQQNFTALTAQMDLDTAEKLQRELAEVIAAKRKNPHFQHRPQLYDPSLIPTSTLKGVDKNGKAIVELKPRLGN